VKVLATCLGRTLSLNHDWGFMDEKKPTTIHQFDAFFGWVPVCDSCLGIGKVNGKKCLKCKGKVSASAKPEHKDTTVVIPIKDSANRFAAMDKDNKVIAEGTTSEEVARLAEASGKEFTIIWVPNPGQKYCFEDYNLWMRGF